MPSFFKKLTVFFMGAVLFGGAVGATVGAPTASAAPFLTAARATGLMFAGGPGHSGTVWAGTYSNGQRGFCLDFGKAMPNQAGNPDITGLIPGMDAEESKQAKYVANKYDNNGSPEAAANAGFAIWRLQHDSAFNTWYGWARAKGVVTAARHNAISAILTDAQQHGPYKMIIKATEVFVGSQGGGTVTVLGSNGKPAVDRWVTITSAQARILTVNGRAPNKGTTGSAGVKFTYQRNTTGKITLNATLTSDSSGKARISTSSAGHQRTLSGVGTETTPASTFYDKVAVRPAMSGNCDSECSGKPLVTFRHGNGSAFQAMKWQVQVGKVVVARLNVRAGKIDAVTARLTDGQVITTWMYCYTGPVLGGGCTTPWVTIATPPAEIVCPAWAQAQLKLPCNCTPNLPASVILVGPAGSPRFYRGFVSINKGAAIAKDLVNGQSVTVSTGRLAKGAKVVISFTAYRDAKRTIPLKINGQFNNVLKSMTVN